MFLSNYSNTIHINNKSKILTDPEYKLLLNNFNPNKNIPDNKWQYRLYQRLLANGDNNTYVFCKDSINNNILKSSSKQDIDE